MKSRLTSREKVRLLRFIGYGNLEADIWFLGMEEKMPHVRRKKIQHEFIVRSKFAPIMDLHEAHRLLKRRISEMKKLSRVWQWMAKLALRDSDFKKAKAYIKDARKFASKNGGVFLVELSPVPASSKRRSGWTKVHEENFGERDSYDASLYERAEIIGDLLRKYSPKYLFAYGKGNWEHYCRVAQLPLESFKAVAGTKLQIRIKTSKGTTIVLLPFLGRGWMTAKIAKKLWRQLSLS